MSKDNKTSIENFEPNVVAAFSYIIPPITGIIFYLIEKRSKFVRFHAMQSILFGAVAYAVITFINSLRVFYIGYFLYPFATVFGFAVWLFLIWKAYQGEEFHLPYIGKFAAENSGFEKKVHTPESKSTETTDEKNNDSVTQIK